MGTKYIRPVSDKGENLGHGNYRYNEGHIFELHADQLGQGLSLNGQTITGNATFTGDLTFSGSINMSGVIISAAGIALSADYPYLNLTANAGGTPYIRFGEDGGDNDGETWQVIVDSDQMKFQNDSEGSLTDRFIIDQSGSHTLLSESDSDCSIYIFAGESCDAFIEFVADQGDEYVDRWRISSVAATNYLSFSICETGSYNIKMSLSATRLILASTVAINMSVAGNIADAAEGDFWYDATAHVMKYQDNAGIKTITAT